MKKPSWLRVVALVVLVGCLAAVAVALVRWRSASAPWGEVNGISETPLARAMPPAAGAPRGGEAGAPEVKPPPREGTDPRARALLEAASRDESLRGLFAEGDLLRRWAVVLDNLAEGALPRRELSALAPGERFSAVEKSGRLTIDPKSYARWDAIAAAVGSVDAASFAQAVRALHPALEATWRALGYPGRSLDLRAAEALRRLQDSPAPRAPPEVTQAGAVYIFADPELEALPAVEKLLLRMGPKNADRIQSKARDISIALGYQPAVTALAAPGR